MKLKEDLLERVRKGELIVKNDNDLIVDSVYRKVFQDIDCLYEMKKYKFQGFFVLPNDSGALQWLKKKQLKILENFCQEKIIKASELIEKEDYTKPLQRGQLCVFFDDLSIFRVMFYFSKLGDIYPHIDHTGTGWNYVFPYEGQTLAEIQEKINNYLKDK